jgi:hypothetical protein
MLTGTVLQSGDVDRGKKGKKNKMKSDQEYVLLAAHAIEHCFLMPCIPTFFRANMVFFPK